MQDPELLRASSFILENEIRHVSLALSLEHYGAKFARSKGRGGRVLVIFIFLGAVTYCRYVLEREATAPPLWR